MGLQPRRTALDAVLILVLVGTCSAPYSYRGSPTDPVMTASGPVVGKERAGIRTYLGIPFAAPPVGSRRWKPPEPVARWHEPRPATSFGPACPQKPQAANRGIGPTDEDCLYLNVWTPASTGWDSLPVLVWIHGGGFAIGAGSEPACRGRFLAEHGVVVVTLNYRIGALGFLAHPLLTAESPHHSSGNYGLLDQIAGLKWVRDNIAAFGGNPQNVTVAGQSAGAVSAAALMTSPLARGLFQRAILHSGAAPAEMTRLAEYVPGFEPAESTGTRFSRALGIGSRPDELELLRAAPCSTMLKAWGPAMTEGAGPLRLVGLEALNAVIVDGWVLEEPVGRGFAAGRQAAIPLLCGTVKDEGGLFAAYSLVRTSAQYESLVGTWTGDHTRDYLNLRPLPTATGLRSAVREVLSDGFVWNARFMARSMARLQPNTYLYHFVRRNLLGRVMGWGVFHGLDVPYLFNTLPRPSGDRRSHAVSVQMAGYWTRFARTGDPNSPESVRWPRYDAERDEHLVLDLPPATGSGLRQAACDILDSAAGW